MNTSTNFKKSIEQVESLPALPSIAQKILGLQLDTIEGEGKLLELIAIDPLISAKIIGLSKSTLFGAPGMIASVKEAAMRLGLKTVKSVAIGLATMEAMNKSTSSQLKNTDIWTRSIAVAMAMKVLSKRMPSRLRPLEDQIFLAGLLHDIGYVVIDFISPNTSNALINRFDFESDETLLAAEKDLLGMSHGEVGAKLAVYWDLPDEIVAVARYHHKQGHVDSEVGQPLVRLVYLAERIVMPFGVQKEGCEITETDWTDLGINPDDSEEIIEEIKLEVTKASQFFQV